MTAQEKRIQLARYRLLQAEESLDEAFFLLTGGKSFRAVVNRVYYAMFYAVLSLLIFEPFSSSKHSSSISYFHQKFIKSNVFPHGMGKSLSKAFELRQGGDYKEFFIPSQEETESLLQEARNFVENITEFLRNKEGT